MYANYYCVVIVIIVVHQIEKKNTDTDICMLIKQTESEIRDIISIIIIYSDYEVYVSELSFSFSTYI